MKPSQLDLFTMTDRERRVAEIISALKIAAVRGRLNALRTKRGEAGRAKTDHVDYIGGRK